MKGYEYNKTWRHKNPKRWHAGKKKNYQSSRKTARNSRERWPTKDLNAIMADDRPSDRELGVVLGKSVQAIQVMRWRMKQTVKPRFRNDLLMAIDLTQFQVFDKGEAIRQSVLSSLELNPGDRMRWDVCQGICGVVEVVDFLPQGEWAMCTLKKCS